ncbi:hypothetical protein [Streptomyces sp. NPDC056883]|uniref:hypothetical protein n=1 Tax=Streptomyces sp. NPDC056883 TaxID=3345959 RepID=UPI0036892D84
MRKLFEDGRAEARRQAEARVVADLREAALRAIYLREKADQAGGAPADINPHTVDVTAYSLASMLTFGIDGDPQVESLGRVVHMVFAGKPERIESRRRRIVWELERLGHTAAARLLLDLTRTESKRYMGYGMVPLGAEN